MYAGLYGVCPFKTSVCQSDLFNPTPSDIFIVKKYMQAIKLFEDRKIRAHWDSVRSEWIFSVIDVVQVLTGSSIPKRYWSDLKKKLLTEGYEPYEKIVRLKLRADDGKMRETDVANTETLLRIIQSIPSPKAEPFKQWLARTGYERIQEWKDPEKGIERARNTWLKMGRTEKWIQQRVSGQETRNKLTGYWKGNGVTGIDEFALLTNIIHEEWAGLTVQQHKDLKGLGSHNLRDHMSEAELIFTALAEFSSRQIAEAEEAKGLEENAVAGKKGGTIAKNARKALETGTGKKVVTENNFLGGRKRNHSLE